MARNENKAVMEKQRATSEEIAKMVSIEWLSRFGVPFVSLMLPGIVVDEAKATVAMRAATTEQDSEVLLSHSPPSWTSFSWCSVNNCAGIFLSLLGW